MSMEHPADSQGKIVVFGAKRIRRAWVDDQWFFSVVDIIAALTDSDAPSKYWTAMKRREGKTSGFQLSTICRQLKLTSSDGKGYSTDAVNTEAAFRIIKNGTGNTETVGRGYCPAELPRQRPRRRAVPELLQAKVYAAGPIARRRLGRCSRMGLRR